MTVAIAVKVFDGIVLAADSASTLALANGESQVYNNANKVFQLHRHLPVGAMTWGMGQIGPASIATLAKDLRRRLMGKDPDFPDWELQDDYTVEAVANRLIDMMFDELYVPDLVASGAVAPFPIGGFMIAGYSGGEKQSEAWTVLMTDPAVRPTAICNAAKDDYGWWAHGQPEAVGRLLNGVDPSLAPVLHALIDPAQAAAADAAFASVRRQLVIAPMPFADAINLAKFLVETTVGFVRFSLGADTVGGPVEVAGISRHEGFKWVNRKHYYPPELNPEEPHK